MKSTAKKFGKLKLALLYLAVGSAILYLGLIIGYNLNHSYIPKSTTIKLNQSPTLVADAQKLGIDPSPINWSFGDNLTATDIKGKALAYFQAPNTIVIQKGQTKKAELGSVAYEYLHYKWQFYPNDQKLKLENLYQNFYDNQQYFRELTKNIVGDKETLGNERNSMACTQVQPYLLTQEFNNYCNNLIPKRNILFDN